MSTANDPSGFFLAEYRELRGEILKRSEIQHQLISIALVALGALTSVGLKDSPSALLAYPMLVLFLSAAWSYNDVQIAQLGSYIRYRIEERLVGGGLGWEHAILSDRASKKIGSGARLATRGILLGTEFLAVGLYLLKRLSLPAGSAEQKGEFVLLLLSIAVIGVTIFVLRNQDPLVKEIAENMQKPVVAPPRNPGE